MNPEATEWMKQTKAVTKALSDELNADVLLYSGPIDEPLASRVIEICAVAPRRDNVVLLLASAGGDANAGYRIGRCLQRVFKRIAVVIGGPCKSAGTLVALCADELVLSDYAELGPLDVQLWRDDEMFARRSGLTPTQALLSLAQYGHSTFRTHFVRMRFDMLLSTKMSAEIASQMSIGAFKEIYAQIDPMRLGEIDRAMKVAQAYGERLSRERKNVKPEALMNLLTGYPSHEFVIDRQEAASLFYRVRAPSQREGELLALFTTFTREPADRPEDGFVDFLSAADKQENAAEGTPANEGNGHVAEASGDGSAVEGAGAEVGGADRSDKQDDGADGSPARAASAKGARR